MDAACAAGGRGTDAGATAGGLGAGLGGAGEEGGEAELCTFMEGGLVAGAAPACAALFPDGPRPKTLRNQPGFFAGGATASEVRTTPSFVDSPAPLSFRTRPSCRSEGAPPSRSEGGVFAGDVLGGSAEPALSSPRAGTAGRSTAAPASAERKIAAQSEA